MRQAVTTLATTLTTTLALTLGAPTSVGAAAETYPVPATGTYTLVGHGWGHGRGLNQWGAQGAALSGVNAATILSTYYPGTTSEVRGDVAVRVRISDDDGTDVQVSPATGLALRDVSSALRVTLPTSVKVNGTGRTVSRWRALRAGSGTRFEALTNVGWVRYNPGGKSAFAAAARFEGPARIRVSLPRAVREYRGSVSAVPVTGTTTLATVNTLGREAYLWAVVPKEAPASWHQEALRAQAVAARTYTAHKQARSSAAQWDLCSTTACQVYQGAATVTTSSTGTVVTSNEHTSTTLAVGATRGQVRTLNGAPILAEFSSSNGGQSVASSLPYQVSKPDPWDAVRSPHHRWNASVSAAEIQTRWPGVGTLERVVVTSRDGKGEWGGRVRTLRLEGRSSTGSATRVELTGQAFTAKLAWPTKRDGLRHPWFTFTS